MVELKPPNENPVEAGCALSTAGASVAGLPEVSVVEDVPPNRLPRGFTDEAESDEAVGPEPNSCAGGFSVEKENELVEAGAGILRMSSIHTSVNKSMPRSLLSQ